jgi:hypothetical protein
MEADRQKKGIIYTKIERKSDREDEERENQMDIKKDKEANRRRYRLRGR